MLFSELPILNNIIDEIQLEDDGEESGDEVDSFFNEDEECEIIESLIQLMTDFIDSNPREISDPEFNYIIKENVKELFTSVLHLEEDIDYLIDIAFELFHISIIPPRSFNNTFVRNKYNEKQLKEINDKLISLKLKPQPQQRTEEWYVFRHNLITASNAYKAFESVSLQNNIIYEKCKPLIFNSETSVNVDSTLHWGQKYEPISVMIYEKEYNTKVGDYGCIKHEKYSFLGASPDGINDDPSFPQLFGRMLEIKNIVNREITGIPKKEYWIQMQLQMENCDLEECDFLETRFTEYENEDAFLSDGEEYNINRSYDGSYKGIIMYFPTNEGKPYYLYKPLDMKYREYELWRDENMEENSCDKTWIKNIYWKLDEYSCVLVLRNRKWFEDNVEQLINIWNTIERERIHGYSHRSPNKRTKNNPEELEQKCLLDLNLLKCR